MRVKVAKKTRVSTKRAEPAGMRELRTAWEAWIYNVMPSRPRDPFSRHVAETLQALLTCAAQKDKPRARTAAAAIAKTARASARFAFFRRGMTPLGLSSTPALMESIESIVEEPSPLAADAAATLIKSSALFGEPTGGLAQAIARIGDVLAEHAPPVKDAEAVVVDVLKAYGVPRERARNAMKSRDMKAKRAASSSR